MRRALRSAIESLTDEQRLLLRFYLLDDLTLEQIARILGIHKTSVFRRLQGIYDVIEQTIRRQLSQELKIRQSEVDSLVKHVVSQLDISLSGILRTL